MKNYLFLQFKRVFKFMPFVVIVTLCLILCLSIFLSGIVGYFRDEDNKQPLTIGVVGDLDNDYMKIGMGAMNSLGNTHIKFVEYTPEEAERAMVTGTIYAYVIFPEDFIDKALHGEIDPVRFITTTGSDDITTLIKNEIAHLITDMVISSEKGTYGLEEAMYENDLRKEAYNSTLAISASYATRVFNRNNIYDVNELGISHGLTLTDYFICGVTILLLFMMGLPYAIIHIKKDYALNRLLLSRGHSCHKQLTCEYLSHFCTMLTLTLFIFSFFLIAGNTPGVLGAVFSDFVTVEMLLRLFPIILMLSAFNILAFELANNIVSGMLIHFFSCLCMCYVAGCIYPIYAFPKVIQTLSAFLPTGLAIEWLSDNFTGNFSYMALIGIMAYFLLFFGIALFVRKQKTSNKQKG